ncbi:DNA (cytosine-5-)-methyltransferase [Stratiformator vulcanicus]|uniref:DNA (cytosine-5-)-methyltransferase n=1 Tax=Stratiformator vulcanicus TaxID=2527980 RepID=UPI0035C6CCD3
MRVAERDYCLTPDSRPIRFVDLFAGIGGMRLGFEAVGAECVFSSEWDKHSQKTYQANFEDLPAGDIRTIVAESIPDHEILTAGFPCQPFSIAGVSKKNALGQAHGFECRTQGTLFFDVARIISAKKPAAFVLENVKNLQSHDKGRTFKVILETLTEDLGYYIHHRVIDAKNVLPQHRERLIIVGTRKPLDFHFPTVDELSQYRQAEVLGDILDADVPDKYTLTDHLWAYLQNYAAKHRAKGNGFGFGLCRPSDVTRTLSARYYKDGSEILVNQPKRNPRRLTPRECARLMGFPDSFTIPVSDTQAYRQFGNSIAVPIVKSIADRLTLALRTGETSDTITRPASFQFS